MIFLVWVCLLSITKVFDLKLSNYFSRRERHAKTIDVAQEEVLTCISLYLYERLHRLWRQVRAEHQTWRVMFYVGVETLRKNFEV